MPKLTPAQVLALPMRPNDSGADTIRGYLVRLGDGFSGKRPFGNSSWGFDLYRPLIAANAIGGTLDPDEGFIEDLPDEARREGVALIAAAVRALAETADGIRPANLADHETTIRLRRAEAALAAAEKRLARVLAMADSWEESFHGEIGTPAAVEAVRYAAQVTGE